MVKRKIRGDSIDFIPFFKFIIALALFGLMMYIYIPLIEYLSSIFPTSGPYSLAMFFMWALLPAVNLFASAINMIMSLQKRRGAYQ